jgi:CRISPR type III-A-associated protein Csm2
MPRENRAGQSRPQNRSERAYERIKRRIAGLDSLSKYGAKDLVDDAKNLAGDMRELKTAQTRKIYGTVKSLEMDFRTQQFDRDKVVLLLPKLAYAANKKREVKPLQEVLEECISKIREGDNGKADFSRFVAFFEAILAYHRER